MRFIVFGAGGIIGRAIVQAMEPAHEVIKVGRSGGDILADYTQPESIRAVFEQARPFAGVISTVGGDSVFRPYQQLTDDDYELGFRRKFLAQTNLVRIGAEYVDDGGSFTLSSGFLSHYPNPHSVATGPFNAAVDVFVEGVAPLLDRGIRLNVVSPAPVVDQSREDYGLTTAERTAEAYVGAATGEFTGKVLRVWGGLENAARRA